MEKRPVVVVGSINADTSIAVERFPAPGETVLAAAQREGLGGKGANQAVSAARAGARVRFIGAVGDDHLGEVALERLAEGGVETSSVSRLEGVPTGRAWVLVDRRGENSIAVLSGANHAVQPPAVTLALAEHFGAERSPGVVLTQGELPPSIIDGAASAASAAGWRFVLNLAPYVDVRTETLLAADPLIVNLSEAAELIARLRLEPSSPPWLTLHEALKVPVVVTRGGDGSVLADAGSIVEIPGKRVPVVDTTGAGDAYVGALVAAICEGAPLQRAAVAATEAAAIVVQQHGAQE